MFHFEVHTNMAKGKSGDCTRLVLRDKSGEIVFFAMELSGQGHYVMGKKGDDGFEQLLQAFKLATIENADSSSHI